MASQTQGIQQLLVAEKRAAEKVAAARRRKLKRIKQAREEANREINAYRQEREQKFREFESLHLGTKGDIAQKIEDDTEKRLQQMTVDVEQNRNKVVEELISYVCDVNPEIHRNYALLNYHHKV